jgi:MFS family permease
VSVTRAPDHPLHHAPFRWLVSGTTINLLGSGIAPVALAFAVLDLGGGASELGLVVGLYALADVASVLFGGVLGDRLPRTVMLQGSAAAAAVVQGVVALSLIGGWSSIPLLAALGMVNGSLSALGGPSSSAITQQTVPTALLQRAISWRRIAQNTALIIGNGVAGLLVVWVGSGWALAFDALTFAIAAALFTQVPVAPLPGAEAPGAAVGLWADVAAGFREVMRHTWLWLLILQALLYHLFYGGASSVLGPIVVGDSLGRPAWGWALSTMMVGFVVGGLVTLRWRPRHALFTGTCFLALTAAFPLAMAWSDSLAVVLAGAALHGFGLEIFSVGWDLSIQEQVAPDKLARVYSFDAIGSFIARPVGLVLTGPLAALVGNRLWLAVVGGVLFGSVLLSLLSGDVRRLERKEQPDAEPALLDSSAV